ncbi:hypothetical protein CKM354_000131100 [Cercospora kikuchii]|uniref:Ubiquitination network signaling protein acrB n=1 Tax=Cercospora kikuchii TaxID=84275 RepID=A0A9P3CCJ4_9PEZI|nr:uncharacterized protein CKM354_000131100 [Cercospora kikuchii]GIZ37880.1 hypothetical protein CKM354_000131100 [Cercospora kikuchii]
MPPKASKSRNASNRDTHDKGLAPPGKRLPRQRSTGQLNAQSNGKSTSAAPPPPLPSTGLNQGFKFPRPQDTSTGHCASAAAAKEHVAATEGTQRDRTPSDGSLDDTVPGEEMVDNAPEAVTPLLEVPHAPADKALLPRSAAAPCSVSTILHYYPLRDAISILILLLSLPPTLVLVIQALFASLTFVPPTAGISLSTLPNIKELFHSPNFGSPAMMTILFVDLFFGLCWLIIPQPAQAIFLDLSHAVIAVSLSGAAATPDGPTYTIALSALLVCIVHVLRYKAIHLTTLDYIRSVYYSRFGGGMSYEPLYSAQHFHSSPILDRGIFFNALRAFLGIHIVSQGITTYIRRTLANAKASEKDTLIPQITKTDTEAIAGTEATGRSSANAAETSQPSHAISATDGRPPGLPPAQRENKARESSSRKKRKQANQIRSQQPLWAAIASTKVTFVKEMEQRDAADDAREASVMTNNSSNTYINAINSTTDRIWICEVRDTEIFFAVDLTADAAAKNVEDKDGSHSIPAGIDRSKPFFIRINGATWTSTRIVSSEEDSNLAGTSFVGEIFGLAPLSSYLCEVVSIAKHCTLCSVSLITQPAPSAEQAAAVPPPPQHSALRPASPITTLKQSIQSAEVKLNEIRNRSKKAKKDQRGAHADIKKEIQTLKNKLTTFSDTDERQEKRLQQISQHKNQAEEATKEIREQIEELGDIPAQDVAASNAVRQRWQSALDSMKSAQAELDNAKADKDRDLNTIRSDIIASETRKERLVSKMAQRAAELDRLQNKQQEQMSAKQKFEFDRLQGLQERENRENQLRFLIAQMEEQIQAENSKAFSAYQESAALSNFATHPPPYSSHTPPLPVAANGPSTMGPHLFGSPFSGNMNGYGAPRGRSSSMLSQYSGFTDNGDEFHFAPTGETQARQQPHSQTWPVQQNSTVLGAMDDRKASDGDGSGSASRSGSTSGSTSQNGSAALMDGPSILNGVLSNGSNSPRPEAKPFIPSGLHVQHKPNPGVIGPPSKKTPPQSPTEQTGSNGR